MRQLENRALSRDQRAELRCQVAKKLEEVGDYEGAGAALGEFWQGVGERPPVERLEQSTAAEVLLRVGTLTGWLGSCKQAEDAQEKAKNLISKSARTFEALSHTKKVLEAQTELAYCYWRQGAYDEARVILTGVLERLTTDGYLKAKAVLRTAIIERSANRYSDALRILTDFAPLFDKINNQTIKGGYHNELGVVFKNLAASEGRDDYLDRAFVEYAAASFHFEQAGHTPYRALVENNLGFLFFKAGKFKAAHEHLERARRLFSALKDKGSVAQVDETRARALLAAGHNEEAERITRLAVRALEKGGRQSLLAEALTTHGTALARLGLYDHAHMTLFRAVEVAYQSGALNDAGIAALAAIEELGEHLTPDELRAVYERADSWLETSQHLPTLHRLRQAANRVLSTGRKREDAPEVDAEKGSALREMMQRYEKKLIRQALQRAGGSVTQAARLLGVTHQALNYMLQNRHRDLLIERTPVVRRKRSIVKKDT
ncbi:MAG TPA: helix-turn-helix domain-containing protein [Pyrinomonadaceae bacterium]|nr:helix-turn-helix domain-containing protein [Pyrinomonadaceae bacterium]